MSEEKFMVKTKSGSAYTIIFRKAVLGKTKSIIEFDGKEAEIQMITPEKNPFSAAMNKKELSAKDLKPENIIYFTSGRTIGNTSRIHEVYKKVA